MANPVAQERSIVQRAKALRSIGLVLVIRAAGLVVSALSLIVVARTLGTEAYGAYGFVMAAAGLICVLGEAGMPQLLLRELANARAHADWSRAKGIIRWAPLRLIFLACLAGTLVLLVVSALPAGALPVSGSLLTLLPVLVIGMGLARLGQSSLTGIGQARLAVTIGFFVRPFVFLCLFAAVARLAGSVTAWDSLALQAATSLIAVLLAASLFWRNLPTPVRQARASFEGRSTWWRRAFYLALSASAFMVIGQADIVMLGLYRPLDEVGLYKVAAQGALLIGSAASAVVPLRVGSMIDAIAKCSPAAVRRQIRSFRLIALALVLPPYAILLVAGTWLVPLAFGANFADSLWPMLILGVPAIGEAMAGPLRHYHSLAGGEKRIAAYYGGAALLNIALNLVLIPLAGMYGAALATLVSLTGVHAMVLLNCRLPAPGTSA
ncbi:MAG: oligosaccharide flippase family protein [Geminicoccaceae bacterium]